MHNRNFLLIMILFLILSGCATQSLQPEESGLDLVEIREQAQQAYEAGDLKTSEKHYQTLVEEVPAEAEPWFRLANIYARTGRRDAAIRAYRETLVRDPRMSKAWYNMGLVQLREAVNSFSELQVYADRDDPLYTQGKTLLEGILELIGEEKSGE